jgi:hypothetical protein
MDQMTAPPNKTDAESPKHARSKGGLVRLSINLSIETVEALKELVDRKGVTITEGIRRAIVVWKFIEDETSRGNQIAVIQKDETVRKVLIL